MKFFIQKLKEQKNFTRSEIRQAFETLLAPETQDLEIKNFLLALSEQPVEVPWLTAAAEVLREKATKVNLPKEIHAIDTAGTGGDQSGSFNLSTASALLASACGVSVAKHGNRSITSKSGSADLLEALGIPIDLSPAQVTQSIQANQFAFMMAPRFHSATKRVQQMRRQLKVVTIFNFLGPLLNPAQVKRQVIGVYDNQLRPIVAEALHHLGVEKAWVLWGEGGLDEITLGGTTYISEVTSHGIVEKQIKPEDASLRQCDPKLLQGGDGVHNAKLLVGIFNKTFFGPLVQAVLLNTAAALVVAGQVENIREGVQQARLAIEEGRASEQLERLKNWQA